MASLAGCAGQGDNRGPVVFVDNCGPCHGADGSGKPEVGAPAIAGLPDWYVQAQLAKYREGARGDHADDTEGLRMRPMARTLEARDVENVAKHVSSLTPVAPDHTVQGGDAEAGKALFATCSACHGADGKGNQAMNAPPIAQLDDWYVHRQLGKFRSGIRGANPKDMTGATMRPMAVGLKDDKAVLDVVAYVSTLSGGH